jgi:hypothetical protein
MSDHHFWLIKAQFSRLQPLLPNKPRGVPRVDNRRVISGIIHGIRGGADVSRRPRRLRSAQDPVQPLCALGPDRRVRPHLRGAECQERGNRHRDDRRRPSQSAPLRGELGQKGAVPRRIRRTKGGINSKLLAVCDVDGKPTILQLTKG